MTPYLDKNRLHIFWWAIDDFIPQRKHRETSGRLHWGFIWKREYLRQSPFGISLWPADQTVETIWNFGLFGFWHYRW